MSGRIVFRAGDPALEAADVVVDPAAAVLVRDAGPEALAVSLRGALRRTLRDAAARGARSVVVPALGADAGLPLQRVAELLLEEARAHLAGDTSIEEIRFVLASEPALRVFESVQDGFRIAEQVRKGSPGW